MERDGDADGEGHPLLEAVQSCIAAAAGEFDVPRQKVSCYSSTAAAVRSHGAFVVLVGMEVCHDWRRLCKRVVCLTQGVFFGTIFRFFVCRVFREEGGKLCVVVIVSAM